MIGIRRNGAWQPAIVRVRVDGGWREATLRARVGGRWAPPRPLVTFPGDGTIVVRDLIPAELVEPVAFTDGGIVIGAAQSEGGGSLTPGIHLEGVDV